MPFPPRRHNQACLIISMTYGRYVLSEQFHRQRTRIPGSVFVLVASLDSEVFGGCKWNCSFQKKAGAHFVVSARRFAYANKRFTRRSARRKDGVWPGKSCGPLCRHNLPWCFLRSLTKIRSYPKSEQRARHTYTAGCPAPCRSDQLY